MDADGTLHNFWAFCLRHPAAAAAAATAAARAARRVTMKQLVVFVDADNVRASMGWPGSLVFRQAVQRWAMSSSSSGPDQLVIIGVDGRTERQHAFEMEGGGSVLVTFSGARWKADDTIVRDVAWWLGSCSASLLVVSSDKLLRKRCREQAQLVGTGGVGTRLRFETGDAFACCLSLAAQPPLAAASEGTAAGTAETSLEDGGARMGEDDSPARRPGAGGAANADDAEDGGRGCGGGGDDDDSDGSDGSDGGGGEMAAGPASAGDKEAACVLQLAPRFVSWVVDSQPRPSRTAWEHLHGAGPGNSKPVKSGGNRGRGRGGAGGRKRSRLGKFK